MKVFDCDLNKQFMKLICYWYIACGIFPDFPKDLPEWRTNNVKTGYNF